MMTTAATTKTEMIPDSADGAEEWGAYSSIGRIVRRTRTSVLVAIAGEGGTPFAHWWGGRTGTTTTMMAPQTLPPFRYNVLR